jgi:hypothetical protein
MAKTESGATGQGAPFTLPADLASHTAEQLSELLAGANAELDTILAAKDPAMLARAGELSQARAAIKARQAELAAKAAEDEAAFQQYADADAEVIEGEVVEPAAPGGAPQTPTTPQLVTASAGRPTGGAVTASRELGGLRPGVPDLNPSLSGARVRGPVQDAGQPEQLAITASVGGRGVGMGDSISSLRQLGDLVQDRAKGMNDQAGLALTLPNDNAFRHAARRHTDSYGGTMVASIRNTWDKVFNDSTPQDVIAEYVQGLRASMNADRFATLVAAGGWCAPSQIRYDFFNIAAQSGMIDLPTFGVERGGIQYPVSPSLADTFSPALPWYTAFSNATMPWLWTEADDILAATGSPTKPCTRVPCSTMTNTRLECYGICVTAGNLADNAWPESTANFLRLVMAAHYHASNARYISTIAGLAVANAGCTASGSGTAAPILNTMELAGWDYRAKFGMARTDVMEAVFPEWALGAIRADLAKRTGVDPAMGFNITDADIAAWFNVRGIRAQFVQDYQVRAAGQPGASTSGGITAYPSTVKALVYAAGTVARGNGMSLDLGVVRDSTLNRTNDFTAAWMEECHLIAKFGHEVREYTMNICQDGTTGAADLTACC